jgi:probable rRNA maturation factor
MSADDIPLLFHTSRKMRRMELRRFLDEVIRRVARGRSIACLITGDAEVRRLNRRFRGRNSTTDVLSFPSPGKNGPAGAKNGVAGDLAISVDRARRQAAVRGHSLEDEVRILILHGALHLTGLDHENDAGRMARSEARWRRRLGLPTGLIERELIERALLERAGR